MSYQVTALDQGHILILTLNDDFDIVGEFAPSFDECFAALESGPEDVVFISDARELRLKSFNDLLQGGNLARSPEGNRVNKHPKIRKTFTVTTSSGLQLAAKGLNSATFGFIELSVFTSLDEAVEQARAALAV